MSSNVRVLGRCHDGQIMRNVDYVNARGIRIRGVSYHDCPDCGGKGCTPDGDAALAAATEGLTDVQKSQIARAVERIVRPAT